MPGVTVERWNHRTYILKLQREAKLRIFGKIRYSKTAMYIRKLKKSIHRPRKNIYSENT